MRTTIADRCTSLIDRARAALRRRSLVHSPMNIRKPPGQRRRRMELLDLELFRNDIGG